MQRLPAFLIALTLFTHPGDAVSVPFQTLRKAGPPRSRVLATTSDSQSFGFRNLDNNNVYVANILVGGVPFFVQLDTGSSDTWVDTSLVRGAQPFKAASNTGVQTETCYYDTTCANGLIWVANVTLGDFIVTQQAIIDASGSNATFDGEIQGLMGLGASTAFASEVVADLELADQTNTNSRTFIDNVFRSRSDIENFMTFQLSRAESENQTAGGIFTIGETAREWDAIRNATKLPVASNDSWAAVVNGFVVNGSPVVFNPSLSLPNPQPDELLALFDTGTTRANAPLEVVHAIYENIPGAVFDADWGEYTLPCDSKVNISVLVGGKEIPIHPIDTVVLADPGETPRTDMNSSLCVGAFGAIGDYYTDVILGDTFLRNTYALFNFGNWTRPGDSGPFIQVLATTDASQAWAEFDSLNTARLAARAAELGQTSTSGASSTMTFSWTFTLLVVAATMFLA